jgi:hypothetical protein
MNNRKVIIQLVSSVAICGALFLFTNATRMDSLLGELVEESNKIESQLEQGVFQSEEAKGIIIAHQNQIGNLIALRMKAKSCAELQRVEKNLKSGIYTLYSKRKGAPFYCHVAEDGSVENEIAVEKEKKPRLPASLVSGSPAVLPAKSPGLLRPVAPQRTVAPHKTVTQIESFFQKLFGRSK